MSAPRREAPVSAPMEKARQPGIEPRHRKKCSSPRADGRCCGASWRAHVFDARTDERIRKTFKTRTEAKLWRQDAVVALKNGEGAALRPGKGLRLWTPS